MLRHAGMPLMSPYYADIFRSIEEEVAARGHDMIFTSVPYTALWAANKHPRAVPLMPKNNPYKGALLIGGLTDNFAMAYQQMGIPVVLVDKPAVAGISSVMPDNVRAAACAARHLIGLGHRRIAFLGARPDPVVEARFSGFKSALRRAGLEFDPQDYIHGSYSTHGAFDATRTYLKQRRKQLPTAILAVNDEAAIGVIRALQASRISVPGRMSVMGFDDIAPAAESNPPLTTVRIPRREIGKLAAQRLFARIEDPTAAPSAILLPTRLVVRESCANPSSPVRATGSSTRKPSRPHRRRG